MKTRHDTSILSTSTTTTSTRNKPIADNALHLALATKNLPSSVIKLKEPPVNVKEILDLDYLIMNNHSLSNNNHNSSSNKAHSPLSFSSSSSSSSSCSSSSSEASSPQSIYTNFSKSSVFNLSNHNFNANHFVYSNHYSSENSNGSTPRSSITNSAYHSDSSSLSNSSAEESLSFQEFVCSIINSDDKEWQILIIQDIARLLELKFRKFKKDLANKSQTVSFNTTKNNDNQQTEAHLNNRTIYLNNEDGDLFLKIAESIFKTAIEEPNGILGARIQMRLLLDSGRSIDMCQFFPYDSNTLATSEITVTIREGANGLKKFLQTFRLASGFVKYVPLTIDTNYFDMAKNKLY